MEADEADVVLDKDSGSFHVSGTPSITKSWADLAVAAHTDEELPEGLQHALFFQGAASFPFGSHVAVVEVDTDAHAAQLLDARARLLAPARALGPAPDLVTLRRPASAGAGPR